VVGELGSVGACSTPLVAITGTNGKTTTTGWQPTCSAPADRPVAAAGNVGQPVTGLATAGLAEGTTVVCECSSFQLEDSIEFAPECAVYLNLAPDHLDRHTGMEAYAAAKLKIFENQVEGDVAIINAGPEGPGTDAAVGDAARLFFRAGDGLGERYDADLRDGMIFVDGEPLMPESDLKVLGRHNVANAMAAALAAISMGLGREQVAAGLASFQGVAHRLEAVGEIEGVTWVNDSKATNVEAATVGLGSFEEGVHLILGGSLKGESFDGLLEPVARCCKPST
jgi:UDP-N-acetylmuramoylalanine--D-glutamate ligase